MQDMIAILMPGAENQVIVTLMAGKRNAHTLYPSDIIRMKALELTLAEPLHGMRAVKANQFTETVSDQKRDNLSLYQLVIYHCNRLRFVRFSYLFRKYIHSRSSLSSATVRNAVPAMKKNRTW
jgi:hypothetical protein